MRQTPDPVRRSTPGRPSRSLPQRRRGHVVSSFWGSFCSFSRSSPAVAGSRRTGKRGGLGGEMGRFASKFTQIQFLWFSHPRDLRLLPSQSSSLRGSDSPQKTQTYLLSPPTSPHPSLKSSPPPFPPSKPSPSPSPPLPKAPNPWPASPPPPLRSGNPVSGKVSGNCPGDLSLFLSFFFFFFFPSSPFSPRSPKSKNASPSPGSFFFDFFFFSRSRSPPPPEERLS